MSKTPFSKQCEILYDFYMSNATDPDCMEFIQTNDLGIPAAVLSVMHLVNLTPNAETHITDSFISLCRWMGIDEYADYDSFADMIALANG